jgi:hypothetical protein
MNETFQRIESDLQHGRAELSQSWERVCSAWQDTVRLRFETEHWDDLSASVPPYVQSLRSLGEMLDRARRELR